MSEKILETLMQLFAIIARPQANEADRRGVVEAFLRRILNQELVKKYLAIYDEAYKEARKKLEKSTSERREGAIAIRIQKLCVGINEQGQLGQEQRIVVVIKVLEFCKSGSRKVSVLEQGFIRTLAEGLNISPEEYRIIEEFVLNSFEHIPSTPNLLVLNGKKDFATGGAKHAYKELLKGTIWILYIPSVNNYFVRFRNCGELSMNGQLLHEEKIYPFSHGSSIKGYKISPIYYWDVTMQFIKGEFRESRVVYEVNNLEYRFRSGEVGIHHMSFSSESGRMVGIMGASGAGKSTLMSVLNGANEPSDGEVLINGTSIHREKDKVKGLIGYVSQDDLLIEELTVFENLYYNAKLCFDNLSDEDVVARVDSVLRNLGLNEIRNMKVGSPLNKKISGGQRKRLNISLELIREPAIMFLDEPTSGLSSRDSENILDLLKELARKGKLLFIVIHQPSSEIFKMFDRLIILDTGGYLIYNGNPVDSIEYFKRKIDQANYNESECYTCGNVNPEQIFNIVESRVFNENGHPTDTRRISPADWRNLYNQETNEEKLERGKLIPDIHLKTPGRFKQLVVFIKRDVLAKISDLQYVLITSLEAPVLAFFLAFLIRYFDESKSDNSYTLYENNNLPIYIFMSVIVSIFMGLTVSAEEIIKDRKILRREAFLNLSWNSYLSSKVVVLFGISAIQALTFVIVGNSITGIKGMMFEYWLVLFTCWAGANMLGLVISDSFKTVVTIYILIPFLVIPQIILSGVLVRFEKLNPTISSPVEIPFYGDLITARWGYEALAVNQFIYNDYEKIFYEYDKRISEAKFKKDYWNSTIKSKLEEMQRKLENNVSSIDFKDDLRLVHTELKKELLKTPQYKFEEVDELVTDKVNPDVIAKALHYQGIIKKHYNNIWIEQRNRKDAILTKLQKEDNTAFLKLRDENANESLEEFVTNENETDMTVEYDGQIIQKLDPIYMDPAHPFIRAHFYSPVKNILGRKFGTFWVNVTVLWIITLILYALLYFRVLKKILDSGEMVFGKKKRNGRE